MGYGIVTTLLYGVSLSPDKSKQLYGFLEREYLAPQGLSLGEWLDKVGLVMHAEDSDSRIHNNDYEEEFEHMFGVAISQKGYGSRPGSSEKFQQALVDPTNPFADQFYKVAEPILLAAGVHEEAGVQTSTFTI